MKRLLCTTLILALLLSACGGAPLETTAPVETTEAILPTETTPATGADNDMSYREEDLPIPDVPTETAAPVFQEYTHRIEDPDLGPTLMQGPLFRLSEHDGVIGFTGRPHGADTDEVLGALGLDADALAELRERNVIR